jgi:hypothetical protein
LVCLLKGFGHWTCMGQFGKAMEEFWLGVMSGFTACMIPRHNMVRLYRDCHTTDTQVLMHRTEFIILTIFTSEPLRSVSDSNPTKTRFAVNQVASAKNGLATPSRVFPHQRFPPTRNLSLLSFPLAEASKGTTRFEKPAKMKYVLVSGGQYCPRAILAKIGRVLTELQVSSLALERASLVRVP